MTLENIKNIFFIGIGGIGMSALARYFLFQGKNVGGYDKTPSILTKELEKEGANIHYNDSLASIPASFKNKGRLLLFIPQQSQQTIKNFSIFNRIIFKLRKEPKS